MSLFDDRVLQHTRWFSYITTYLPSSHPASPAQTNAFAYAGAMVRYSVSHESQHDSFLSFAFCISIARDVTTGSSCTYACARTVACCLLALHASRHISHTRQRAGRQADGFIGPQPQSLSSLSAQAPRSSPLGALAQI